MDHYRKTCRQLMRSWSRFWRRFGSKTGQHDFAIKQAVFWRDQSLGLRGGQ